MRLEENNKEEEERKRRDGEYDLNNNTQWNIAW